MKFRFLLVFLLLTACTSHTKTPGLDLLTEHLAFQLRSKAYVSKSISMDLKGYQTKLHYWDNEKENKPIVILIHGVGADALINWQSAMKELGDDYRVIAPDILWYGKSTSELPPKLDNQVMVFANLIDSLGSTQAIHLVGYSYGGFIVYGLLANYSLAHSATFISSPGASFSLSDFNEMLKRFTVKEASELFVPKNNEDLKDLLQASSYYPLLLPAFTMNGLYQKYFQENPEQKEQMLNNLIDSRDYYLKQIMIKKENKKLPPMQIIWGEADQIFPLDTATKLSESLLAPLYIVTQSGHNLLLEKPSIVNRLLKTFFHKYN